MIKNTYIINNPYIRAIILMLLVNTVFSERGDLISSEILSTRTVSNNQAYIDDELGQIVSDQFSIEPAQYGYWLYKITY